MTVQGLINDCNLLSRMARDKEIEYSYMVCALFSYKYPLMTRHIIKLAMI